MPLLMLADFTPVGRARLNPVPFAMELGAGVIWRTPCSTAAMGDDEVAEDIDGGTAVVTLGA